MCRAIPTPARLALAGSLLAAILSHAACDRPGAEPASTRDFAGVPTILSTAPAWAPAEAWVVEPEPALVLGGIPGQRYFDFSHAREARIVAGDRLLVTHATQPPEVRLFRPDGSFIRAFGGAGSDAGQGHFFLHSWLAGQDTLIVYDPILGRLTRFHVSGAILDSRPVASGPTAPVWVDRLADGRLLGRPNSPQPTEPGRTRARFTYSLLDPLTGAVEALAEVEGAEFVVATTSSGQTVIDQVLFAPFTAAVARGTSVYLSDSHDFWIDERAADGRLLRRFGRDWKPTAIGRGFIREYNARRLAAAGRAAQTVRQEIGRAVFAEQLPAHEPTLIVDATDHLWILHVAAASGQDRLWSVFGPDGVWLGEVRTPAGLRVTGIGADRLVGVAQEDERGQTIRIHRLINVDRAGDGVVSREAQGT